MFATITSADPRRGRVIRLGAAVAVLFVCVAALLGMTPDRPTGDVQASTAELVSAPAVVAKAETDSPSTAAALRRITQVKAAPAPSVTEVTDGLMVELGLRASDGSPEQDALKAMSLGALSGIKSVTGQGSTAAPSGPATLQSIVAQALREGKSDSYIDALVNEAAGRGDIVAPRELMTADGKVDTHVLLAGLVAKATRDAGMIQPEVVPGGEGVEVRIVQKADGETEKHHFYTVNGGDSLGAIAQKFYGDATRYMDIYEANRMIVASPDKIRVGQRLVIPAV
jgi:nucleoid-associated protein YgaU